jgi:putative tryptophan/tyrosine transport system substrate-binding protein
MRRREFIASICAATAWPFVARAEQAQSRARLGWLVGLAERDAEAQSRNAAVIGALQELGWTVGRNINIDYHYTIGDGQDFDAQAAAVIARVPEIILVSSTPATLALQRATKTIPIVFVLLSDPVISGVVTNLARPSSNVTGFTNFEVSMGGKWLELLKQVAARITKVAIIFNPRTMPYTGMLQSIETAAPLFDIAITTRGVADAAELDSAIAAAGRETGTALIVLPDIFNTAHHEQIIALAAQHNVPAIYAFRYFAAGGGLMSYGTNAAEEFRRAASYVDRILKGAKPGDLPVQAPNKFEFVINLKTAKASGSASHPGCSP